VDASSHAELHNIGPASLICPILIRGDPNPIYYMVSRAHMSLQPKLARDW